MSEVNASFDVEAQQSLLVISTARAGVDARRRLVRTIWTIRSIIRLGAAAVDIITSSSADNSSVDHQILIPQLFHQVSADILSAHPASNAQNIELQHIHQRKSIAEMVRNKNLRDLNDFGGVRGVAEALSTDLESGNIISNLQQTCSQSQPSHLYHFLLTFSSSFLQACNNYTIFLLTCAAVLSLAFGIKEDGMHRFGWLNGVVLIFNVCVIIIFTTVHKCWREWSNNKLDNSHWHSRERMRNVLTVRGGAFQHVSEVDLEVGDIAFLRRGEQVPADGLFIRTSNEPLELDNGSAKPITVDGNNPFLFYGSRVVNGNAKMLVTSTRMDTVWGEMMCRSEAEEKNCTFESCIHNLSMCVHISGLLISILIIIVLFIRYEVGKLDDERKYRPDPKNEPTRVMAITDVIMGIVTGTKGTARVLTTLLSISLLGIMEGVPFVISIATIIWSCEMLGNKATAKGNYLACLKMASVTTICTDKFGVLTEHRNEIDKFYVGEEFVSESSVVGSRVLEVLCDGIGMQLLVPPNDSGPAVLVPVISWAEATLGLRRESLTKRCKMRSYRGRNPLQERCQVLMEKNGNEGYLHCNGLPLDILASCSRHYDINGEIRIIDGEKRSMLAGTICDMLAEEEAGVIAYACKQVDQDFDDASVDDEHNDLIFLAMISVKEVKIEDTKEVVSALMECGLKTILASGDDVGVLETIGRNCGLIDPGSEDDQVVVTGEEFRNWSDEEKMDRLDKIGIIGNCLLSDKILFMECLRKKGHVVGLLAQRTIDAPALKLADIGLTFGTWASDVARQCCDINLWDRDCFGFVVEVIKNGRCFQGNVRKFLQLQLIFTVSCSLITFTVIVSLGDAPMTAVQLFWLNSVIALVGGLALLRGAKTVLISTAEVESSAKLITKAMWRNIAIQASYQTTVFVTLQHRGQDILGTSADRVKSVVYNGFFLCQLFEIFIAREPEKRNIFSGLFRNNFWFWVACVIFVTCQGVFGVAERVVGSSPGLNSRLWGACLLVGLVSLVVDWAGKSASILAYGMFSDQGRMWRLNSVGSLFSANEPTSRHFSLLNTLSFCLVIFLVVNFAHLL